MPGMEWSDSLELGLAPMDATHREFVACYNLLADAPAEEFLLRLDDFIAHTIAHFSQENAWMEKVGFPGCHRAEHDRVLAVMADVRKRVAEGDPFLGMRLVEEIPAWFETHAGSMDAALAFHLAAIGFDPVSGEIDESRSLVKNSEGSGCACAAPSDEKRSDENTEVA